LEARDIVIQFVLMELICITIKPVTRLVNGLFGKEMKLKQISLELINGVSVTGLVEAISFIGKEHVFLLVVLLFILSLPEIKNFVDSDVKKMKPYISMELVLRDAGFLTLM